MPPVTRAAFAAAFAAALAAPFAPLSSSLALPFSFAVFLAFIAFFTILRRRLFIALTYSYCTLVQYLSFCPISFLLPNIFPAVPLSPTFAPLYACARSVPRSSYRRTQRKKGLSPLIRSAIIRVPPSLPPIVSSTAPSAESLPDLMNRLPMVFRTVRAEDSSNHRSG